MKALSKYNAPLTVPLVLVFLSVPVLVMFVWILLVVPHLSPSISRLEDSSPIICSLLQGLLRFMMLPVAFIALFLTIHFYQRHHDRMQRARR